MNRARVIGGVLAPVVLAAGVAAAVLPRAIAHGRADADAQAAALTGVLPDRLSGVVAGSAAEEVARRSRSLPVVASPANDAGGLAGIDGSAAAAVVDTTAALGEASQALGNQGVVVADGSTGIPVTVLAAYRSAEAALAAAEPSCHLPWWVLAGIGRIESDHASGGRVDANGTTRGRIVGIALDGSVPGTAVVTDTDGGQWDGDPTYDRAVGPMQFLPGSWRVWGKDGNGDGIADPNNVYDAATAAGYLLCSAGDLSDAANLTRAVLMYNHSDSYVASVLTWGAAYRDGVTPSADSSGTVPAGPVPHDASTPTVAAMAPASAAAPASPASSAATPAKPGSAASASTSSAPSASSPSTSSSTSPASASRSTTAPATSPTSATSSTTTAATTSPTSATTSPPSPTSTTTSSTTPPTSSSTSCPTTPSSSTTSAPPTATTTTSSTTSPRTWPTSSPTTSPTATRSSEPTQTQHC